MMQQRFYDIKGKCIICLERRKISIQKTVHTLRSCHIFSESNLSSLSQAIDHSELFANLDFSMNYLSFDLLDTIINAFDLEDLKSEMEEYKSHLQQLKENTPLIKICQIQPKSEITIPLNIGDTKFYFNISDTLMMKDVEQFKTEYCCYYGLHESCMILAKVGIDSIPVKGSIGDPMIAVTWLIPEVLAGKLSMTSTVPRNILKKYSVTKSVIAGRCPYRIRRTKKLNISENYSFVEQPSKDFLCPVTQNLLLQPHLTSCCGKHLSQEVASRIQQEQGPCPLCNAQFLSTILNKHFQREVKALPVFCPHKEKGCDWQGELSERDYHLHSCPKSDSTELMEKLQ